MDQGTNEGIIVDLRENLAGDVERRDVAYTIYRLIEDVNVQDEVIFSIINKPKSNKPSEYEWGKLMSLFTTPRDQLSLSRESATNS